MLASTLLLIAIGSAGPHGPLAPEEEAALMVALSLGDPPSAGGGELALGYIDAADFDLPLRIDARTETWMRFFLGEGRPVLESWRSRLPRVRAQVVPVLKEHSLPEDLLYVAMVESGFNNHAVSRSGAVGLWQFMPETARAYGLRVDDGQDDRRDLAASTRAAATYLAALHRQFADWHLALAAYNGGPGTLQRAMKASRSRSLAVLGSHLSDETQNYVPKIMAVAVLDRYAERYGL